jgi:hypothetical protein
VEAGSLVDSRRSAGLHPAPRGHTEAPDGAERLDESHIGSEVCLRYALCERGEVPLDGSAARGFEVDEKGSTRREEDVSVDVGIAMQGLFRRLERVQKRYRSLIYRQENRRSSSESVGSSAGRSRTDPARST